ncbi:MAG: hypothetical protein WC043_00455 [Pseudobdellovibrionaceae bacterium]
MIIAINQRPYDGPWGGGNRFVQALCEGLRVAGHQVVHALQGNIDIILMVETRLRSPNVTFDAGSILRHLAFHPDTVVVHRINECDERKGEKFITHKLLRANYAADYTVFVGSWLKDLPAWRDKDMNLCKVILNGADTSTFNAAGFSSWTGEGPLRLVTHHWGYHRFKGFDVYEHIDHLLGDDEFSKKFSMSYVGRLPEGYKFKHIRHIEALDGEALASVLKTHHAYVTASLNEPGGNHQNEGACCGLPIVYRKSGCMPEYCGNYGIGYDGADDIAQALATLRDNYSLYAQKVKAYPHTAEKMVQEWLSFFDFLFAQKPKMTQRRNIWRNIPLLLRNQIPV